MAPPPGNDTNKVPLPSNLLLEAGLRWASLLGPRALAQAQSSLAPIVLPHATPFRAFSLADKPAKCLLLFRRRDQAPCPHSDWSHRPSTPGRTVLRRLLLCLLALEDGPSGSGAEQTRGPAVDWTVSKRGAVPIGGAVGRRRESLFSAEDWR